MKKYLTTIFSIIALSIACVIVRFPLFPLHGMQKWPVFLFNIGVLVIAFAGFGLEFKLLPVLTVVGYSIGFFLGYLFQFEYGNGLNSLWIIWTCSFDAIMIVGTIAEVVCEKRMNRI